ncbi:hypothetical protein E5843_06345 [Luteimonas yindakuii]|uniref:hypothetical protein n=1 Tax=Luteimonas yindakuii TaxID=2565782 RepID=UPI0010A403BE|nr:hypothetical protein [Luteimonas yindakuii]QCO67487.1 hypothetical protein E5843_06345 [Luteimonas yindakuii]
MRALLVAIVVFAVVWLCAIGLWRGTGATPGGVQMALVLGVLPLALLGGVYLVRKARRREPTDAGASPGAMAPDGTPRDTVTAPAIAVRATAVCLPSADNPADALAALVQPRRPGLHPTLRDRDGLPVFAASVEHVDTLTADGMLQRHAPGVRAGEEALRALALLEQVAETVFADTAALLPRAVQTDGQVIAGMHHREAATAGERVDVQLLLPAAWPTALREASATAMRQCAADCGLPAAQLHVQAVPVADAREAWSRLRLVLDAADTPVGRDQPRRWHVLLAADSQVGAQAVRRLESAGLLLGARHQDGVLPGEGAAGVLLLPAADCDGAMALLHPLVDGETSLASLRAGARATADLLERAMRQAAIGASSIGLVLSDADQRSTPAVETAAAVSLACPDLDPVRACAALCVPNGALGIVAPVAQLALAAARVVGSSQPVLALSLPDERRRLALVVVPPVADDSTTHDDADASTTAA